MDKETPSRELKLIDKTEGEDTPQETKDIVLKDNFVKEFHEEKDVIDTSKYKDLKEYNTNTLLLNSYWIELVSKAAFGYSLIIYELIGYSVIGSFLFLIDGDFNFFELHFILYYKK